MFVTSIKIATKFTFFTFRICIAKNGMRIIDLVSWNMKWSIYYMATKVKRTGTRDGEPNAELFSTSGTSVLVALTGSHQWAKKHIYGTLGVTKTSASWQSPSLMVPAQRAKTDHSAPCECTSCGVRWASCCPSSCIDLSICCFGGAGFLREKLFWDMWKVHSLHNWLLL